MMTDDEITEKWIRTAKEIGFSEAGVLNPETLKVMPLVRETCAEDKCHAYNHNWTCPPACGTLDECESRMRAYKRGIIQRDRAATYRISESSAGADDESIS